MPPGVNLLKLTDFLAFVGLWKLGLFVIEHRELLLEVLLVVFVPVLVGHKEFVTFLLRMKGINEAL